MKCPVCPVDTLPDDAAVCPNCKTDLTALQKVRELAKVQFNHALKLESAGQFNSAISRLETSLILDNRFISARIVLGKLLWKIGHHQEALRCWQSVLEMDPDNSEAQSQLNSARLVMRKNAIRRYSLSALAAVVGLFVLILIVNLPYRGTGQITQSSGLIRANDDEIYVRQYLDSLFQQIQKAVQRYSDTGLNISFPSANQSDDNLTIRMATQPIHSDSVVSIGGSNAELSKTTPPNQLFIDLTPQFQALQNNQSLIFKKLDQVIKLHRDEATSSRSVLAGQALFLNESMLLLFKLMGESQLVTLSHDIKMLQQQADSLGRLVQTSKDRNILIFGAIKRHFWAKDVQKIQNQIASLQNEYLERAYPWTEATRNLNALYANVLKK